MGSILSLISLFFQVVIQIPNIIKMIQGIQLSYKTELQEKIEKRREDAAAQNAADLKAAQEAEDESKQQNSLSSVVDDYNS